MINTKMHRLSGTNAIKNANFIAIDFETATTKRMPCQIGIVVVKEGTIVEKISKLIQPPGNRYSDQCVKVHKITPEITKRSPTFDQVWNDIKSYFEGNFIIAHNASFDLDVLKKSLHAYNIPHPIFMGTSCTYELSGMSLVDACNTYNIPLCSHHDGLCDAEACAQLFLKYLNGEINNIASKSNIENYESIRPLDKQIFNNPHHNFDSIGYTSFLEECSQNDPLKDFNLDLISSLQPLSEFINKRFIITGGTIFNRDHAYQIIEKLGGKKSSSISKSLNYAILGKEPGPKKIEQIDSLKAEGYNINIISDIEFIELIKSSIELHYERQ